MGYMVMVQLQRSPMIRFSVLHKQLWVQPTEFSFLPQLQPWEQ